MEDHDWNDSPRIARALEVIVMLLAEHVDGPAVDKAIVEAARRQESLVPPSYPVWLPVIILKLHERLSPKIEDVLAGEQDR